VISASTVFFFAFKPFARGRSRQTKLPLTAVCINAGIIVKRMFPHLIIFVPADPPPQGYGRAGSLLLLPEI
jgi:hypothetical protein